MRQKSLTAKQRKAAAQVAEDELTDEAIAEQAGVTRQTLGRWKQDPLFLEAVQEHTAKVQAAMLRLAIAKRHKRVERLDRLESKLWDVIDQRAAQMAGEAPGADTGTLVRQIKQIGSGKDAATIEEYAVDTGLVRELRALYDQAAVELGQKITRAETSSSHTVHILGVDVDEAL